MATYAFGSGSLWALVNGAPSKFGVLQEGSVDISASTKELFGQNTYPVTVARGESKITGKAKAAFISAQMFNQVFFTGALTTGQTGFQTAEAHSIPGTGPFTITITPPSSGTFVQDLGVSYTTGANAGVRLIQVASGPTTGQYSVAGAVYTFAAADDGLGVAIDYSYTIATGQTLTVVNTPMGQAPQFIMFLGLQYQGRLTTVKLFAAVSTKLSLSTKTTDFTVPEFDFSAFADAGGNVIQIAAPE